MTFPEFRSLVAPLAVQLRAEYDLPTWKLYHQAVEDVPVVILVPAVQRAARERTKFPSAAELRRLAEVERQRMLLGRTFTPCEDCTLGWKDIEVDGVKRVTRCGCWHAYQRTLEDVPREPLALLEAAE